MPQQSRRADTRRTPTPARRHHLPALVAGLSLLCLATACGGQEKDGSAPRNAPSKAPNATEAGVVAPAKVEVIAGLTGCTPDIRIDADELRQGACRTKSGNFLVTTFPEERLKDTWLDSASVYGGTFLIGPQWVVSAKADVLERLRPKLGGTVKELRGIGTDPGGPGADGS